MKSKSYLLLLFALLLLFSTTLVGCGLLTVGDETAPTTLPTEKPTDAGHSAGGETETIANESLDYKVSIEQWAKYVSFDKTTLDTHAFTASKPFLGGFVEDIMQGNDLFCKITDTVKEDSKETTYTIYNTDAKILSTHTAILSDSDYAKNVTYTIDLHFIRGMYEVKRESYVDVSEDGADEPVYELKTQYNYYTSNGMAIATNLDEPATVYAPQNDIDMQNQSLVYVADKTYVLSTDDGSILAVFERAHEYSIPNFDYGAFTPGAYAFVKYGEYTYMFDEEEYTLTQIGDFTMFTVPGMSVTVFDKDYNVCATYKTNSYATMGYSILSNGDVYVSEYELLSKNATEYDLEMQEEKFNVLHTVLKIETGEIKRLDKDYMVSKPLNNTTKDIKSFLSTISVTNSPTGINSLVKDGYILAEVQKIKGKALSNDVIFAVIDEKTLDIVAELPTVVPNQFGYVGFIDQKTMLITAKSAGDHSIFYTASLTDYEVDLFIKNTESFEVLTNGYYYKGGMYDKNWKLLCNFVEEGVFSPVEVDNGKVYYTNEDGEIVIASISDSGAYQEKVVVHLSDTYNDSVDFYFDNQDLIWYVGENYAGKYDAFYDENGKEILRVQAGKRQFSEFDLTGKGSTARQYSYDSAYFFNFSDLEDGSIIIHCYETLTRSSDDGDDGESAYEPPEELSYVTYYIVK